MRSIRCIASYTNMDYQLNAEQQAFVNAMGPHVILSARPGSGKTHSLVARIDADQGRGTDPATQAVVTKTVAASTVMRSRLRNQPGFAGTIHALALNILNERGEVFGYRGYRGDIEVITEEESREIMNDMANRVGADKASSWQMVGEWNPKTAAGVAAMAHQRVLRERNQTDFPCMLAEATRIGNQYVLDYCNSLYVDEHQDTTAKEAGLLRALKASRSIVVGDEDQAIFGWDGSLDGMYSWEGQAMSLTTNYRSGHFIIEAANNLASHFTHYRPGAATMVGMPRADSHLTLRTETRDDAESCSMAIQLAATCLQNGLTVAILCRHNHLANRIIAMCGPSLGDMSPSVSYLTANERRNIYNVVSAFARVGTWTPSELRLSGLSNRERRVVEVAVHRAGGMNKDTLLALDERDIESRRCYVGTVHGFKGNEADVVYYVGTERERLEKGRSDNNEERKVFYVALTRAIHLFHAIHARSIWIEGKGELAASPSVFLEEMKS